MPNWSGGAEPQASSVSQSGVARSARFTITSRIFWICSRTWAMSDAYGCRATTSK